MDDVQLHPLISSISLLASFSSLYLIFRPPNPPAPKEQQVKDIGEWWFPIFRFIMFTINRATVLSIFVMEAYVAVLIVFSGSPPPLAQRLCTGPRGSSQLYSSLFPSALEIISYILIITGTQIRLYAQRTLGRHFTFEVSLLESHQLITDGPYAYVRHPGYTGGLLAAHGLTLFPLVRGTFWRECLWEKYGFICTVIWAAATALLVFMWAALIKRMRIEDEILNKEFGEKWDDWAKRTKFRLVPGLY